MTPLASLYCSALLFFPFWLQIWENKPIAAADLNISGYYEVEPEALDKLREGLPLFNADIRNQIMRELSEAPVPANQKLMLQWLAKEKVPEVQCSILRFLQNNNPQTIPASSISPFLKSDSIATAQAAITLYGRLPGADLKKLLHFLKAEDSSPLPLKLRKAAWLVFSQNPEHAALLKAHVLDFRQDSSLEIQALALQVASYLRPRRSEVSAWLDQAADGPSLLRLAAAKDPFPEKSSRLTALLRDQEPGIRIAACAANTGAFQKNILSALNDPHQAVRLAAAKALGRHQDANNQAVIEALLRLFSDPVQQVRQEAEASVVLIAQQGEGPARQALGRNLASQEPLQRLHSMQALTSLGQNEVASVIAAIIPQESTSENLSAAFLALGKLAAPGSHGELLQNHSEHPSPLVRAAVAHAIGKLRPSGTEPILQKLSLDQKSAAVRIEAFAAMGYFPRAVFAGDLLRCLNNTAKTQPEERRNAAWAAGKLIPSSDTETRQLLELAKRLVLQCSRPVIPGMEPMFEGVDVIGNAIVSLAKMQKRFPEWQEFAECAQAVLRIYSVPWQEAFQMNMHGAQMPPPVDATSNSMAFQVRQWLNDEKVTTTPIPPTTTTFSYCPISETN
jgi:HEAT repeat protein